jgi:hypothetical protein
MSKLTKQEVIYILEKLEYAFDCPTKEAVITKLAAMHKTRCEKCGWKLTVTTCENPDCCTF